MSMVIRSVWRSRAALVLATLTGAAGGGCAPVEQVRDWFADAVTPHERYTASLLAAGLDRTALTRDWLAAAEHAFDAAVPITPPHGEEGYLAPDRPAALGFRIAVRRGQRLFIAANLPADSDALVFLDLFEAPRDTLDGPRALTSADSGATVLEYEPRRDGEILLRVQPELLRGGHYTITVRAEPILAFPVHDRGLQDIGSVFGDPRDGGRRDHHGVDIFAPRGTAALAAVEAVVRRVETTERGGNVVWLRDERRGLSLYYAHLDRQTVTAGTRVQPGDTVGLIGNTGNARTTPPHLHFGVYWRGPVDPYPFVYRPRGRIAELAVDPSMFGRWARAARDGITLAATPDGGNGAGPPDGAADGDPLTRHTAMLVLAGSGSNYRVRLPDGRTGWIAARVLEAAERPIAEAVLPGAVPLHAVPGDALSMIDRVGAGPVEVLARFRGYALVRSAGHPDGWIDLD